MLHSLKPTFKRFRLVVLFVSCVCFSPSLSPAADGARASTETTKDGVRHVANPAHPIEAPSTFKLNERWRVGGDDETDEVIFGVLNDIATDDDGNVYARSFRPSAADLATMVPVAGQVTAESSSPTGRRRAMRTRSSTCSPRRSSQTTRY